MTVWMFPRAFTFQRECRIRFVNAKKKEKQIIWHVCNVKLGLAIKVSFLEESFQKSNDEELSDKSDKYMQQLGFFINAP